MATRRDEEKALDVRSVRKVGALEVHIDRDLCVGFGDCVTEAPDAFKLDEDGIAVFRNPDTVTRERLLAACASCPVDALTVRNEDGHLLVP